MPIEIKELVIRAVVQPGSKKESSGAAPQAPARHLDSADAREEVVNAAVREVLRILKSAKER